ncbi:hypothetical protein [Streptomyces sp. NPDC000994]
MLAGLLLAAYFTCRATVAEAWRILHFRLRPHARTWLGIDPDPPTTARESVAASRRLYRGFDRITTVLDPARCDRRSRLPQDIADDHARVWNSPAGLEAAERLQLLANQLVLAPVRMAQERGHLRGWRGDVGVDATAIPVLAHPDSDRNGTASVEITAGWHYSGGSDKGNFGYSATFVVAAHRRPPGQEAGDPTGYPQMCVGLVLDTPTVRTGRNAITALQALSGLGLPVGTCAADRAYTGCSPENFQIPVRRLGYRLALDYKAADRGTQGSWQGVLLVDGTLTCRHMPAALANATHRADDKTVREIRDNSQLTDRIAARTAFHLRTKEGPDDRGSVRLHCPAAGPSPSVNCARRDRLRPQGPRAAGPPQAVLDISDARRRAAHPAAKPTVQIPSGNGSTHRQLSNCPRSAGSPPSPSPQTPPAISRPPSSGRTSPTSPLPGSPPTSPSDPTTKGSTGGSTATRSTSATPNTGQPPARSPRTSSSPSWLPPATSTSSRPGSTSPPAPTSPTAPAAG